MYIRNSTNNELNGSRSIYSRDSGEGISTFYDKEGKSIKSINIEDNSLAEDIADLVEKVRADEKEKTLQQIDEMLERAFSGIRMKR